MTEKNLKKNNIVNSDYESVFLGRRTTRNLDSTYKVPREEIEEIIKEALIATPSAVGSIPYKLIVIDTEEGKKKLDDIMWPVDKSRVLQASFVIVPCADRQWIEYYDDIVAGNKESCPAWYDFFMSVGIASGGAAWWYDSLIVDGDHTMLDKSINFQAGLIAQSLMIAARAHGLDSGFMDAWSPEADFDKVIDIDLERYIPEGVIAFGKAATPGHDSYRLELNDLVEFH